MKFSINRARLSVLSLACISAFSASAQSEANGTLGDVVVTASRSEQLLNAAPVGASIIRFEEVRDAGVADANEAIRVLGGVIGRKDLNGGREASLDLRAYGDAASSNMVVLVNGVRISENELASARLSAIAPEMIERIEIVRGGASVLWGAGASAGVINVITRDSGASAGVNGSISVGLESFDTTDVRANVFAGAEGLKFFAQGRNYKTSGYRANNANEEGSINAGVTIGNLDTLKTELTAFSDISVLRWSGPLPVAQFESNPKVSNTPKDHSEQKIERLTLTLEKKLSVGLVSLDIASKSRDIRALQDYGSSGTDTNHPHSEAMQISPKLNFALNWSDVALDTVVGVDAMEWTYKRNDDFSFPGFGSTFTDERGHQNSQAFYLRSNLTLDSGWRVDAGWRTEQFDQSLETVGGGKPIGSKPVLNATELGVSRTFNDMWSAYARTASSFRVANIDELRYQSAALAPQQANDIEVGLRYADRNKSFGLRVFNQNTSNEIQYDNNLFLNVNLDPVRRDGVEFDGQLNVTESTKLSASVQAVKAVLSEGVYVGNRLPLATDSNVVLKLSQKLDTKQSVDLVTRIVGKAPFGNDLDNKCGRNISATEFVDFAYRYSARKETGWSMLFAVENLLDRQGYSTGYTNSTCSAYNVYPGDGRRLRLRASYDFK